MIYLNQAATTFPKPQCVLDAHTASLYKPPLGQFRSSVSVNEVDIFEKCRQNLGKMLGITAFDRIFFSSGATDSSNAVIYGLPLEHKNVVITQTEHNSILRPLKNLTDQVGSVTIVPCGSDGSVRPEDIEKAIIKKKDVQEAVQGNAGEENLEQEETAAVFVNHCSNVTGMIQDLKAIGEITKRNGVLFVVDASQSAGCIPVNVDEWGIDVLIFTGHKSLFGVQGTGGYYVRPGIPFLPYRYGGTGRDSRQVTYEDGDYEYEAGTQNTPGITALNAGVEYLLKRGVMNVAEQEQLLMKKLYQGLRAIPGVWVYGDETRNKGPVMSFNMAGLSPSDVAYILQNCYDIVVRTGLHCAPLMHDAMGTGEQGTVRVSISDLTQEAEIETLLGAVKAISESLGGEA